jgi:hypothetical protein
MFYYLFPYLTLQSINSYIINLQGGIVGVELPRGQPLVLTPPELSDGGGRCIDPGLTTWIGRIIWEESYTTNGQVDHKVKLLIERCHLGFTGPPRIGESARFEVTPFPEATIRRSKSGQSFVIDRESDVVFGPHHLVVVPVDVESGRVHFIHVGQLVHVGVPRWTPVQSRTDHLGSDVDTGSVDQVAVATTFHDVDLAGSWPEAVLVPSGHQPYS